MVIHPLHYRNIFPHIGTRRGTRRPAGSTPPIPMAWQEITGSTDAPPFPIPFAQPSGPAAPLPPTAEPIEFYKQLVDERVIGIIVDETNRFAWIQHMYMYLQVTHE